MFVVYHLNLYFTKSMNFYVQKNNNLVLILKKVDAEEGRKKRKDGRRKVNRKQMKTKKLPPKDPVSFSSQPV